MQKKPLTYRGKHRRAFAALFLVCLVAVGGILAFLTAQDTKVNRFTMGNISINLCEDFNGHTYINIPPEPVKDFVPTQLIDKKPWIENTGENDFYAFMTVGIPVIKDRIYDNEGHLISDGTEEVEAFVLLDEDNNIGVNDNWTLLDSFEHVEENDGVYNYYLYGYAQAVVSGQSTEPLFNNVRAVNFGTGSGEVVYNNSGVSVGIMSDELSIPVTGYAIQTELPNIEVSSPITETQLNSIFALGVNLKTFPSFEIK